MVQFQFNHLQLGLTYPQANGLTKIEVEDFFINWRYQDRNGEEIKVDKYLIALESHQPTDLDKIGGIHFHVYVKFTKILRARDTTLFDIEDMMGETYHPHIDKVRGVKNMIQYCTKEDEVPFANFDYKLNGKKNEIDWEEVYNTEFDSAQAFLDYMKKNHPGYYTNHYIPLREIANDNYGSKIKPFIPKYTVFNNVPFACKAWVDNYLHNNELDRPLSLILVGETRTGKTAWARSLGRHMYFGEYFNLDCWDDDAEYAIFDDFDKEGKKLEEYFPQWKCWFGAQEEFTVTDKYRRKQSVKWGKPIIFITNNEIECSSKTLDYIRKNSIRVNVYSEFY